MQSSNRVAQIVPFLEEVLNERPSDMLVKRALAQAYQQAGRVEDAVAQLDTVADTLLSVGKKEEAMMIVNQILLLNPPNSEQYRQLLSQIQQ